MVKTWPFRKVAVSDLLGLGDHKNAIAVFSTWKELFFFFDQICWNFRKVKDLSLAEQLYLYERTRRFKDPPFDKQPKDGGCFFFSTGKKNMEKHSMHLFSILVVWRWGVFFCKPPTLEQVFESERLHVFFPPIDCKLPTPNRNDFLFKQKV